MAEAHFEFVSYKNVFPPTFLCCLHLGSRIFNKNATGWASIYNVCLLFLQGFWWPARLTRSLETHSPAKHQWNQPLSPAQPSPACNNDNRDDNDSPAQPSPAQPTIMRTVTITIAQPSSSVPCRQPLAGGENLGWERLDFNKNIRELKGWDSLWTNLFHIKRTLFPHLFCLLSMFVTNHVNKQEKCSAKNLCFIIFTRLLMANALKMFILDTFAGNTSMNPTVLSRSAQPSPR